MDTLGYSMNKAEKTMVVITGYKDTGKTTAIEGIVKELSARGYEIGTMKHCHHGFDLDRPGKDSWRHRRAGPAGTALVGPYGFAMIGQNPPVQDPRSIAAWLFPEADLVIAEGFHWLNLPRIEIVERGGQTRSGPPEGELLARLPHRFGLTDIRHICDLLELRLLEAKEECP